MVIKVDSYVESHIIMNCKSYRNELNQESHTAHSECGVWDLIS